MFRVYNLHNPRLCDGIFSIGLRCNWWVAIKSRWQLHGFRFEKYRTGLLPKCFINFNWFYVACVLLWFVGKVEINSMHDLWAMINIARHYEDSCVIGSFQVLIKTWIVYANPSYFNCVWKVNVSRISMTIATYSMMVKISNHYMM